MTENYRHLPVIDISPLVAGTDERHSVAAQIGEACRAHGFFYITGHGVSEQLAQRLDGLSRKFFALPEERKLEIAMARGGRAWRGYFPLGGELTSGRPDLKEGLYFGAELSADHPLVLAGTPMHGPNLFPSDVPQMRAAVLDYMAAMTALGHALMRGLALGLGLSENWFADHYTGDPLILFRIFHYPPDAGADDESWGVGEHTDYGLLTMLRQDDAGGLEVKTGGGWVAAPGLPGTFICNIGDMLERMTGGLYKSTPHRVRNLSGRGRVSLPFFFDPNFFAEVKAIESTVTQTVKRDDEDRWDQASVHDFSGTYGEYLLGKVGKVFPQLRNETL